MRKEDIMQKKMFSFLVLVLVCFFASGYVLAESKYPERPIQFVIPYAPGGSSDINARLMGEYLAKYIGQTMIPTNKPGASGTIGGAFLANCKPDGYTIGQLTQAQVWPEFYVYFRRASYTSKDLQHVACWYGGIGVLCVNIDSPWKSLKEFLEYAKSNPGKIKWGNSGTGNAWWAMGASLTKEAGIKAKEIPFSGDGESLIALLGKHIDMAILTYGGAAKQHIDAKTIKPLCVFTEKRPEELPSVPTVKEFGYQQVLGMTTMGIFAPKGTPKEIVHELSEAIRKVTEDVEFRDKCKNLGTPIFYLNTKDFEEYDHQYIEKLKELFKEMSFL